MFKLWQMILALSETLQIDFSAVLEYAKSLWDLGRPPSLDDKESFREWLKGLAEITEDLTDVTTTKLDDHAQILFNTVIQDDEAWTALYAILTSIYSNGSEALEPSLDLLQEKTGLSFTAISNSLDVLTRIIDLY